MTEINPMSEVPAVAPKKHGWLPVLVVLFLISYGLMTMLIVEQGRTIESQRVLIRELYRDSAELSAARMKAQQHAAATPSTSNRNPSSQTSSVQTPSTQTPLTQAPSTQTPSTQAPLKQAPSTQAKQQSRTRNEAARQKAIPTPSRPASDLVDADRSLILI